MTPTLFTRSAGALWVAGGLAGTAVLVAVAVLAPSPWWTLGVPLALLAGTLLWVYRHPLLPPALIVVSTLALMGNTPGLTAAEVAFVLVYGIYLVWFYGTRLLVFGGLDLRYATDRAFALFLAGLVLVVITGYLFNGDKALLANSMGGLLMVALYFPVREACARHPQGLVVMTAALLFVCATIAVSNLLQYRALLAQAVLADYIAGKRVTANDIFFTAGFSLGLALVMRARQMVGVLLGGGLVMMFAGALIATQARGQWVACAVSAAVLFVLGGAKGQRRLVGLGLGTVASAVVLIPVLLGSKTTALVLGLARRFGSISTAAHQDISLLSRYVEADAALHAVLRNPVLGYGTSVSFPHYDIITQQIWNTAYVHVGYLGIFYAFGLWGSLAILTIWGSTLKYCLVLLRSTNTLHRTVALGIAGFMASLVALLLVTNPFVAADGLVVFSVLAALVSGAVRREQGQTMWQQGLVSTP